MSNFRRLLQASQQEPSYTELEYIECTGTQYIDTGIVANSDTTSFELDYNLLAKSDTYYYGIVGARVDIAGRLHAISNKAGADSYWGTGTGEYLLPKYPGTLVGDKILTYNRLAPKTYYINSTSITNITESFSTETTLSLGAIHRQFDNSYLYPAVGLRIKRFKLWENNVAIMDCIPVLNQNGVPCLYDRIAKNFLYNAGTGVFTGVWVYDFDRKRSKTWI